MIPGVPSMGGAELLIILLIILLFFGANRLPKVGRSLGSGIREFRQGLSQGGNDDKEEVQDRKIEQQDNEREPSLNGAAAHNEAARKEEPSRQTEQKKA